MDQKLVEKGRLVTFKHEKDQMRLAVVTDIQTQSTVVCQYVRMEKGGAEGTQRVRVPVKNIRLLDDVVEILDTFTEADIQARVEKSGAIERFTDGRAYKSAARKLEYLAMDDFTRFMADLKAKTERELLRAKGVF